MSGYLCCCIHLQRTRIHNGEGPIPLTNEIRLKIFGSPDSAVFPGCSFERICEEMGFLVHQTVPQTLVSSILKYAQNSIREKQVHLEIQILSVRCLPWAVSPWYTFDFGRLYSSYTCRFISVVASISNAPVYITERGLYHLWFRWVPRTHGGKKKTGSYTGQCEVCTSYAYIGICFCHICKISE